ncbi:MULTISPECIES: inositol monophosphatase family protein [unclassified Nesterenkonia]|uniref:inositol monophosphatase family protein n=1 Tax=unclassified Nesterenkonia TaxID=2629769 RepID=UPI001F4CF0F7|nr:inositol monophosphatase [Nesterenkonia sp. DZ6]MCH8570758.1 inositol monophosphatase [Nesterenkonia sp. AY15]
MLNTTAPRPDPRQLRTIALEAAEAAGAPLVQAFRAVPDDPEPGTAGPGSAGSGGAGSGSVAMGVSTKTSTHDLVTIHDTATEDALAAALTAAVPDSWITGEESGARGSGSLEWIIDPIDGTSNFAHGFAMFSISIAAVFAGEVIAGVVHDPINRLSFSADDDGAYLSCHQRAETRLGASRSAPRTGAQLNLMTSYPSAEVLAQEGPLALEAFAEMVTSFSTVRRVVSGALELCHAAAGWNDVVLGVDTKPWDIAAGMLILRRAGGTYLALGGSPEPLAGDAEHLDGTADHLAPDYLGLGPGVDSPAAHRLFSEASARRRRFSHS